MATKQVQRFDFLKIAGKPTLTDDGFLVCPVAATRAGIFIYHDAKGKEIRELRPREEVTKRESLETLAGKPVTNKHPQSGLLNGMTAKNHLVGSLGNDVRMDGDHVITECRIYDAPTIKEITVQGRDEVSCGYTAELDETPGEDPVYGRYDSVQRNIKYNHLAVALERGRGGPSVRMRLDSLQNQVTEGGMAKIKIDNTEYEMEDAAVKAVQKCMDDLTETRGLLKRADEAIKDADDDDDDDASNMTDRKDSFTETEIAAAKRKAVRALMDSFNKTVRELESSKGKLVALEGQRMDSMTPEKISAAIQEKFRVVAVAASRLDGVSVAELSKLTDMELKKKVILAALPETKLDGKSADFIDGMFDSMANDISQAEVGRVLGEMLIPSETSQARPGGSATPKTDGWKKPLTAMKA